MEISIIVLTHPPLPPMMENILLILLGTRPFFEKIS